MTSSDQSVLAAPPSGPRTNAVAPRRRLTREESQAQTRARLIAVGREHFLRFGLGGAVAEKIAEEAGYSRGALYSNFSGKEDLFLAVMEREHERHSEVYNVIFRKNLESSALLQELRAAHINMLVDPDWVILWADFQAEAVRNEEMRERYRHFHETMLENAVQRITEHIESGRIQCRMSPRDFILAISSFAHGLAVRQRVLGSRLPEETTRRLIGEMFDALIQAPKTTERP